MKYLIIKMVVAIVMGILLCVSFVLLARRDATNRDGSSKTIRTIVFCVLAILGGGSIFIAFRIGSSDAVEDFVFDTTYRAENITSNYYGVYKNEGTGYSEEFELWRKYQEPMLRGLDEKHRIILFEATKFMERFGQIALEETKDKNKLDKRYRDSSINKRIEDVFGKDKNYSEIQALSSQEKFELLLSDYLSEEEIRQQLMGQEEVIRKRQQVDIQLLIGFILLAIGLYILFYKYSSIPSWKKVLKVLGYVILIIAYFNCTDYHPDYDAKRTLSAVIGELILIGMSIALILLSRKRRDTLISKGTICDSDKMSE